MCAFFKNPKQQYINDRSIMDTDALPKFATAASYTFESFRECTQAVGISALLEQRWASQEYKYTGEAACIPIPDSLNPTLIPRTPGQFTGMKSEIKAVSFGKPSFFYNWVAGQSSTLDCQVSSHTLVRPEMLYTEIC